jgi:hypothetical protein
MKFSQPWWESANLALEKIGGMRDDEKYHVVDSAEGLEITCGDIRIERRDQSDNTIANFEEVDVGAGIFEWKMKQPK